MKFLIKRKGNISKVQIGGLVTDEEVLPVTSVVVYDEKRVARNRFPRGRNFALRQVILMAELFQDMPI